MLVNLNLARETDYMKKLIAIVLASICVLGLTGCGQREGAQQGGEILTLDKVIELSAKGEDLSWGDFEQYKSKDVGSGLHILLYEIDETFDLWIGGSTLDEPPLYITLALKDNRDDGIDIRVDDVKAFIEANEK